MFSTRALHVVARLSLRFCAPLRAKAIVDGAARWTGTVSGPEGARAAAAYLDGHGTCLSRALAIAAQLPGAEVVIAVAPAPGGWPLGGHAWVEHEGRPLRPTDVSGEAIVRLC